MDRSCLIYKRKIKDIAQKRWEIQEENGSKGVTHTPYYYHYLDSIVMVEGQSWHLLASWLM